MISTSDKNGWVHTFVFEHQGSCSDVPSNIQAPNYAQKILIKQSTKEAH